MMRRGRKTERNEVEEEEEEEEQEEEEEEEEVICDAEQWRLFGAESASAERFTD